MFLFFPTKVSLGIEIIDAVWFFGLYEQTIIVSVSFVSISSLIPSKRTFIGSKFSISSGDRPKTVISAPLIPPPFSWTL